MALPFRWHPYVLVFNMLNWKHMVVTMVKPKWILWVCQKCSYSGLHMTSECRNTKLWLISRCITMSLLSSGQSQKKLARCFRLGKALAWPAEDFTVHYWVSKHFTWKIVYNKRETYFSSNLFISLSLSLSLLRALSLWFGNVICSTGPRGFVDNTESVSFATAATL
jgi:hypothetical protein